MISYSTGDNMYVYFEIMQVQKIRTLLPYKHLAFEAFHNTQKSCEYSTKIHQTHSTI